MIRIDFLKLNGILFSILLSFIIILDPSNGGIAPPHWVDLKRNPCASQGWQLLYWAPDQACYKIFQTGYPCPETMELTPSLSENVAECKCPPGTAQLLDEPTNQDNDNSTISKCYNLFEKGPCKNNQFFSPDTNSTKSSTSKRIGVCRNLETCPNPSQIWWPRDERCYQKLTRGPCPEGQLLIKNSEDELPTCDCRHDNKDLQLYYWNQGNSCHELYTPGPCTTKGHLFLPGGKCGCSVDLPHFHRETSQCYKLGDIGPCSAGHQFKIVPGNNELKTGHVRAKCVCKEGYVFWKRDGKCYRLYTQGPCDLGQFLINSTSCMNVPCDKGYLYFPKESTCYRIGSQGPCNNGYVVTFDYSSRPSIDGISYQGTCDCAMGKGLKQCHELAKKSHCDHGKVLMNNICHMLYTQGPCDNGQWLYPKRTPKWQLWEEEESESANNGMCRCKPGYSEVRKMENQTLISITCEPPLVNLASYLNSNLFLRTLNKLIL
ncbi:uncharacterized protein LOC123293402 [Chrysoperla carnea]|uniref:uncharacterized protein LOC123293402 n=1 Tax=Chrysoperla carnea TaxID=189513 RepID=UPI001D06D4F4|nr:uncharacterized protein LOC123293402 [Chrysoperla carnea]